MLKKWLKILVWSIPVVLTLMLLIAAMQQKEEKNCRAIQVNINGKYGDDFIDAKDVIQIMKDNGAAEGKETTLISLKKIEEELEKDPWIKKGDLFFDNNQVLQVRIEEREPLARVFTSEGESYYIDSSCKRLPLNNRLFAGVPMFTSFPSGKKMLANTDSMLLKDIKEIAEYILKDSFWLQQIAQIDITPQRSYEVIPVIGNQVIRLGNAQNLNEKFGKLMTFYKQVWSKAGFEKYQMIDVQYQDQIVATKRGAAKPGRDTTKAMREFTYTGDQIKLVLNDPEYTAAMSTVHNKKADSKVKTTKKNNVTKKIKKPANTNNAIISNRKPKALLQKKNKSD